MDFRISGSNQTVYAANTNVTPFGNIYSDGSSNTIFLTAQVGAAPTSGSNTIYGVGDYNLLQYFQSPGPVSIDFKLGIATNGFGGTDRFTGITGFQGSSHSDQVDGSSNAQVFYLGTGSDTVRGGGGIDKVTFYSDLSTDYTVRYIAQDDLWTVSRGSDTKYLYDVDFVEFGDKTFVTPKPVTLDNSKPLSHAGSWIPITAVDATVDGTVANTFYSLIKIGSTNHYGIALTGWGYSGFKTTLKTPSKVSVAFFTPDSQGTLSETGRQYLKDTDTWGGGSVVVADFNGDGQSDLFFAAHNESPHVSEPSTAYLSRGSGVFDKVQIGDSVQAHDAQLFFAAGVPRVVATTYGGNTAPVYTFRNGAFAVDDVNQWYQTLPDRNEHFGGSATAIGYFGPSGALALARADAVTYSGDWKTATDSTIKIFAFSLPNNIAWPPAQTIPAYLSTLPEYKNTVSMFGPGITHINRIWNEDLNQDGHPDLIAGQSMWSDGSDSFPSALQLLINNGDGTFKDATKQLHAGLSLNSQEYDYTPSFVDLDQSGINTLLFAGISTPTAARQSNHVLLNDGTGRLHSALHEEFLDLTPRIYEFLAKHAGDPDAFTLNATTPVPKFIGIPQPDGSLNFVAQVSGRQRLDNGLMQVAYEYVNIPLHYNPATDFTENVTVADRNNSLSLRTWAGADTFTDQGVNRNSTAASPTKINGGGGSDTSTYSGKLASYTVTAGAAGSISINSLASAPTPLHDALSNIEHIRFADFDINTGVRTVASSVSTASLHRVIELYIAFFNRAPDADGLSYWLTQTRAGVSTSAIAESFYSAGAQYTALTGFSGAMTNADFVNVIYRNVLGRSEGADTDGLSYWTGELASGRATRGGLVSTMLDSAHTFKGDATWGWVANLLDNKIAVARQVAVDWGLNYLTPDASVANGMAIARAVTPTDTRAAIALVGIPADAISLG